MSNNVLVFDNGAVPGSASALATKLGGIVVEPNLHVVTTGEASTRDRAMKFAVDYIAAKNGSHPQASIVQLAEEIYQFLIQE